MRVPDCTSFQSRETTWPVSWICQRRRLICRKHFLPPQRKVLHLNGWQQAFGMQELSVVFIGWCVSLFELDMDRTGCFF